MLSDIVEKAALLLVSARQDRTLLADLPGPQQPKSTAEAYAIQNAVARSFGPVGGWKVALSKDGGDPKAASVPSRYCGVSGGIWLGPAPVRLEVEIALKLGADLPKRAARYERAAVRQAIASVHVAFELLETRFKDKKAVSSFAVLADSLGNGGLIMGDALPDWPSFDLAKIPMTLHVGGKAAGSATDSVSTDQILDAVTWLANHVADHMDGLRAGQVVLTGARIGPVAIPARALVEATAKGAARVSVTLDGDVAA
jgi:2-keto-4-pentenoate hydratase